MLWLAMVRVGVCAFHLADRYDRNVFVGVIPADTRGTRVKGWSSVNQKSILVMPMGQLCRKIPPTIRSFLHRNRCPLVEITRELDRPCLRRVAIEIRRLE
jgi:hypothetical protein